MQRPALPGLIDVQRPLTPPLTQSASLLHAPAESGPASGIETLPGGLDVGHATATVRVPATTSHEAGLALQWATSAVNIAPSTGAAAKALGIPTNVASGRRSVPPSTVVGPVGSIRPQAS